MCGVAEAQQVVNLYDDLGRLSKVVDTVTGQCAVYNYDAVGNILSIERQANCIATPVVTSIAPAADAGCFVATGQNLLGATVSADTPGVSVSGLSTTNTSVHFCLA